MMHLQQYLKLSHLYCLHQSVILAGYLLDNLSDKVKLRLGGLSTEVLRT